MENEKQVTDSTPAKPAIAWDETRNDYNAQTSEILTAFGVTFATELVGNDCPQFCEDARKQIGMDKVNTFPRNTHIHGKHYRCTFTRITSNKDKIAMFDFWNSYSDEEYNALLANRVSVDCYGPLASLYLRHGFIKMGIAFRPPVVKRSANDSRIAKHKGRQTPTAYDVLACVQKYPLGSFEEFCNDFGYDSDSIRALSVYGAVAEEYQRIRAFFTADELAVIERIS